MSESKIEEVLTRGVASIYPSKKELENVLKAGKRLKIYNGIDPTSPSLHLGHAVVLRKLAQFQNLGHKIILLIGDFTGMIGDPTGKLSTRRQLSHKTVLENAKNYQKQAEKILQFKGPNAAEIKYNSHWLSKMSLEDWFKLASLVTYQQFIERDMFQQRIAKGKDIFLHEFFYPLLQGYDSVAMDVDMEIGGTDQIFNMLVGRRLMKKIKNKEKFIVATSLLTDPKGQKMGKTTGNMISLDESPVQMFGKLMALPDDVMPSFFQLLTDIPEKDAQTMIAKNPMEAKKQMAWSIVRLCHSEKEANASLLEFERVFQKKKTPKVMPLLKTNGQTYSIVEALFRSGSVSSKSQAKKLIIQGAIEIDKEPVKSFNEQIGDKEVIIKIGKKRFLRILP